MPKKPRRTLDNSHKKGMSVADIERKTFEIQQGLAEQRARRLLLTEQSNTETETKNVYIPGMVYDVKTGRYFKRGHFTNEETIKVPKKIQKTGIEPSRLNIMDILHRRCLIGTTAGQIDVISHIAARSIYFKTCNDLFERNSYRGLQNIYDIKYHPSWGLAICSGGVLFSNPEIPDMTDIPTLLGVEWQASCNSSGVPIISLSTVSPRRESEVQIWSLPSVNDINSRNNSQIVYRSKDGDIEDMEWMDDSSLLVSDCENLVMCRCDALLPHIRMTTFVSKVASVSRKDCNAYIVGLRNGSVFLQDKRVRMQFRNLNQVCSMRYCIDHILALSDSHSAVIRDVVGNIDRFDMRFPNKTLVSVCSSASSSTLSRSKFWVSPGEDFLLTSGQMLNDCDYMSMSLLRAQSLHSEQEYSRPSGPIVCAYSLRNSSPALYSIPVTHLQGFVRSDSLRFAPNSTASIDIGETYGVVGECDMMRGAYICVDKQIIQHLHIGGS